MRGIFSKVFLLLMLAAYLVPSTGILLYVHHCESRGISEASLDGSSSCCPSERSMFLHADTEPCHQHESPACTHHTFLDKEPCCSDTQVYIKITPDYLASNQKTLESPGMVCTCMQQLMPNLPQNKENFSKRLFANTVFPPGQESYLLFSSLRL